MNKLGTKIQNQRCIFVLYLSKQAEKQKSSYNLYKYLKNHVGLLRYKKRKELCQKYSY
jgi:hypothetical protein